MYKINQKCDADADSDARASRIALLLYKYNIRAKNLVGGSYGRRYVCYVRKGENYGDKFKFMKHDASASVLWHGLVCRLEVKERFESLTKVNTNYYINHFWRKMLHDFFLRVLMSWHLAKHLKRHLYFSKIYRQTSLPLMRECQSHQMPPRWFWYMRCANTGSTEAKNKHACRSLKNEWHKFDQETINKTLKSWPKRCRLIYYCKGSHIKQLLQ